MSTKTQSRSQRKNKSKKRKVIKWISIVIGIFLLAAVGIGTKIWSDAKETVNNIKVDLDSSKLRDGNIDIKGKEPISLLLLGVDERAGDRGRSDTMIVLTINPKTNDTKMLSIPRDTYTEIAGHGMDKINHAYAYGGIELSRDAVEGLLEIPIDYVVQVNMDSFKDIVDAVGGITIDNQLAFSYGGDSFALGEINLNGEEALNYVRMRKEDPEGDFGRQNRQKKAIQGIVDSAVSVNTALNYKSIFDSISNNVRMNATYDELMTIQKNYKSAFASMEQLYMNGGNGTNINGIYYYIPDETEFNTVKSTLKSHLEIK